MTEGLQYKIMSLLFFSKLSVEKMSDRSDLCLLGAGWQSLHPGPIPALLSQPSPSENWEAQEPEVGMRWETTWEQGYWLGEIKLGREENIKLLAFKSGRVIHGSNRWKIPAQKINHENQLLLQLLHWPQTDKKQQSRDSSHSSTLGSETASHAWN